MFHQSPSSKTDFLHTCFFLKNKAQIGKNKIQSDINYVKTSQCANKNFDSILQKSHFVQKGNLCLFAENSSYILIR